jgi:hypothetical protein
MPDLVLQLQVNAAHMQEDSGLECMFLVYTHGDTRAQATTTLKPWRQLLGETYE